MSETPEITEIPEGRPEPEPVGPPVQEMPEAVTAVTFLMTMDGQIAVGPTKDTRLLRPPTDTDLRVLALFLHDQVVVNSTKRKEQQEEESLKEKLARLLEERRSDG